MHFLNLEGNIFRPFLKCSWVDSVYFLKNFTNKMKKNVGILTENPDMQLMHQSIELKIIKAIDKHNLK